MLTAKQIESLPAGTFPNSYLRRKFGTKHGHVVPARVGGYKYRKDGKLLERDPEDVEFIGNRSQYEFRKRNPLKKIRLGYNSKFQKNRFENQERADMFSKFLGAFMKLFKYLFKTQS